MATAAAFFHALEQENTREHWQGHRAVYDTTIRPGFQGLVQGVTAFGPWRVYRAANDTRFAATKAPYKTFVGAVAERADGVGAFVKLDARGLLVGTGIPQPAPDQLPRLREAIAEERPGRDFEAAVATVRATAAVVHGGRWEPLKRAPRGFSPNHPRVDYLRWKGVEVNVRVSDAQWVDTPSASTELAALLRRGEVLHSWLARHVGPSDLTPEERFAPKSR